MFTLAELVLALAAGFAVGALGVVLVTTRRAATKPQVSKGVATAHIFARRGEIVTCVNGHLICQVARDIQRNEPANIETQFKGWRQDRPDPTVAIPPCAKCAGPWFMNSPVGGMSLHFEDGWRS